jgi:hypothetical protein
MQARWLMPVRQATQEVQMEKIKVQGHSTQKDSKTPISNNKPGMVVLLSSQLHEKF